MYGAELSTLAQYEVAAELCHPTMPLLRKANAAIIASETVSDNTLQITSSLPFHFLCEFNGVCNIECKTSILYYLYRFDFYILCCTLNILWFTSLNIFFLVFQYELYANYL